ncbi:HEAT repeat domain-containing protein [Zavarzinella formosa]|uniref:HEAT repeat domain-containing protein n=1 Tax=Zavarzinella formosa TaxID=360055 RepID=UPI0012F8395F|nr:HEAT repeat domain-containing protein [Zavarzinella formosa]
MIRSISRLLLAVAGCFALGMTGCAGTYDLVTSQRFRADPFGTMFKSSDPMTVLESNPEGDERVRAMRDLKEPKRNGGSDAEQDKVVGILQTSATTDRRPLCRLAAVEAISKFDDKRSVPILLAAYQNAPYDAPPEPGQDITLAGGGRNSRIPTSTFTPETVTVLQCTVLQSLGKYRDPEGLRLLCEVALSPTPKKKLLVEQASFLGEHMGPTESDRMDVRMAAIRSLGNYEGDPKAAQVLVSVMETERDVAVLGRTHEALVSVTGQDLPADPKAWTEWLATGGKMRKKSGLFR